VYLVARTHVTGFFIYETKKIDIMFKNCQYLLDVMQIGILEVAQNINFYINKVSLGYFYRNV
jgi:hypothetical protein